MTAFTCATVRDRLEALHDRELPVRAQIAVEAHLRECRGCRDTLQDLRELGEALRRAAAPPPPDEWTGVRSGVISRMRAEANEAWPAKLGRMFDDMHLVWIGLASTAASLLCAAIALGTVSSAATERHDSLAGVFAVMAAPSGSDLNPARLDWRYRVPSVPQDGVVQRTLEDNILTDTVSDMDSMLALSAVVTRDGSVADLSILTNDHDGRRVTSLLDAISQARLQPAELAGSPVAVNLVWLVAQTTVKPIRGRS